MQQRTSFDIQQLAFVGLQMLDEFPKRQIVEEHVATKWMPRLRAELQHPRLETAERALLNENLGNLSQHIFVGPPLKEVDRVLMLFSQAEMALRLLQDFETLIRNMNDVRHVINSGKHDPKVTSLALQRVSRKNNSETIDFKEISTVFDASIFFNELRNYERGLLVVIAAALEIDQQGDSPTFRLEQLATLLDETPILLNRVGFISDLQNALEKADLNQSGRSIEIPDDDDSKLVCGHRAIKVLLDEDLLPDVDTWKQLAQGLDSLATNYMTPGDLTYLDFMPIDFRGLYLMIVAEIASRADKETQGWIINQVMPACVDPYTTQFLPGVGRRGLFADQIVGAATNGLRDPELGKTILEEALVRVIGTAIQADAQRRTKLSVIR